MRAKMESEGLKRDCGKKREFGGDFMNANKVRLTGTITAKTKPRRNGEVKYGVTTNENPSYCAGVCAPDGFEIGDSVRVFGKLSYVRRTEKRSPYMIVKATSIEKVENLEEAENETTLSGRISSVGTPKRLGNGKVRRSFMIDCGSGTSIPCLATGEAAKKICKNMNLTVRGSLKSRTVPDWEFGMRELHEVSIRRWKRTDDGRAETEKAGNEKPA